MRRVVRQRSCGQIEEMGLRALLAMRHRDTAASRVVLAYAEENPLTAWQLVQLMVTVPAEPSLARAVGYAAALRRNPASRASSFLQLAQMAAVRGQFRQTSAWIDTIAR